MFRAPTPRLVLVAVNAALLGALAMVTLQPGARAAEGFAGQPARPRGQYIMTAGRMQGASSHAIYVLDTVNQELAAMVWDRSGQRLSVIGYRSVAADAASSQGR